VARDLTGSGVPVRVSVRYTVESDPDGLLGRPGGYVSKLAFTDTRVNGGVVADGDPGSVSLGGVIEVFANGAQARGRALRLQQEAVGIPTRAEYDVLAGRVLIRLSRYLPPRAAAQYQTVVHGVDVGGSPAATATASPIGA
jgi:hypothetical protein